MNPQLKNKNKKWVDQQLLLHITLIFIAFSLFLFSPKRAEAQTTVISGQIIDSASGEPVPFANLIITNSRRGTLTDISGNYSLEVKNPKTDYITASLLGYKKLTLPIKIGQTQKINFEIVRHNEDLPEVIITYEGNPADAIVDSIIKYKERSTFQSFEYSQYESYTKAHIGVNNLSEEFFERKIFEPFEFIADYNDTSLIDGKVYTPVMIAETRSTIYERKSPRSKREIINASRISGLDHTNVSQFVGNLILDVNVY